MRDFLDQVDGALDGGHYYVALVSALAIPDIFGALGHESGVATGERYAAWFDENMPDIYGHKLPRMDEPFFSGGAAYGFRCSLLHQARTGGHPGGYSRVVFYEPGNSSNVFHLNVMGDVINIDVRWFCRDLTTSARVWLNANEADPVVAANLAASIQRYPDGLKGLAGGSPVIG